MPPGYGIEQAEMKARYTDNGGNAKPGASIVPVIVAQLINLHSLPISRRIRHRLCHHQRLWFSVYRLRQVTEDIGGEVKMILERELRLALEKR